MRSSEYPRIEEWQRMMNNYHSGIGGWIAACVLCGFGVWLLYRWLPLRWRSIARFTATISYAGVLLVNLNLLPALPAMAIFGSLGYAWQRHLRLPIFRLPKLHINHVWLIIIVATLLRVPGLFSESLWYDETFTAAISQLSFDDMAHVAFTDVHPPLWYLLTGVFVRLLGTDEWVLRLPALLFGVAACILTYQLARHYTRPRYALYAALLNAVISSQLYYSSEARAYTLLVCVVLMLMLSAIRRDRSSFLLLSFATPLVHAYGIIYVAAIGFYWFLRDRHAFGFGWLTRAGLVASPGALLAIMQSRDVTDGFWLMQFHPGAAVTMYVQQFIGLSTNSVLPLSFGVLLVTTLSTGCLLLDLRKAKLSWLLVIVVFGVPSLLAMLSATWTNVYLERGLLPTLAIMPVLWMMLFEAVSQKERQLLGVFLLPGLLAGSVQTYNPTQGRVALAELLARGCPNTEQVYATSLPAAFIGDYYIGQVTVWQGAGDLNQSLPNESILRLWDVGDIDQMRGEVCIIEIDNALAKASERQIIRDMLNEHPHRSTTLSTTDVYTLIAHEVTIYANAD
jgi:hypothetical protein